MKHIIFYSLLLFSKTVVGQTGEELIKEANRLLYCQRDWKYLKLKDSVEGKVLFYDQPMGACGGSANASNTLIVTNKGDTIRILQLCDNPLDNNGGYEPMETIPRLKLNDYVKVTLDNTLDYWRGGDIPYDPFSCIIKETYFAIVSIQNKKKNGSK